jgi:hypothetical protein
MDIKRVLHDVEVLMRRNHGRGVVFFAPVDSDYATQYLASDPKKMLFIFDRIDADSQDGFLYEVFGYHRVFDLGADGFHEHATELLEGFGVVNHFDSVLNGVGESSFSVRSPFLCILSVFVPPGPFSGFAKRLWFDMAEI